VRIRVGHLYPDYLNIYADRGNIAVLARRASWRGHELEVTALGLDDAIVPRARTISTTWVAGKTASSFSLRRTSRRRRSRYARR